MVKNILTSIAAIIFALLLSEITLALLGLPKYYDTPKEVPFQKITKFYISTPDSTLFYLNYPSSNFKFIYDGNLRGYFDSDNSVSNKTNSSGFRGDEFVTAKDSNTFRIAFIGDSYTFGEGVKDEDTYPEKIKQKLQKKYPARKIECYNFGVGGYDTENELFVLKSFVLAYHPDAVVVGYNLNDVDGPVYRYDKKADKVITGIGPLEIHDPMADLYPPGKILNSFRISRFIYQIIHQQKLSSQTIHHYQDSYTDESKDWIKVKKELGEIMDVCRQNKIPCYVTIFPFMFRLDESYPFKEINEKVKQAVEKESAGEAIVVDLFPAFKGLIDAELWVHPTDHHPNEVAQEITAEKLASHIKVNY